MYTRIQHGIEPSCDLQTLFVISKILGSLAMVLPKALNSPDGHTMVKDALTNGPMSSRSVANLKLSIIVCPSRVKIG